MTLREEHRERDERTLWRGLLHDVKGGTQREGGGNSVEGLAA
jgi:hypothetical protein